MIEEDCTKTGDDKPEEKSESRNLGDIEAVEDRRQNHCRSVGKYDGEKTTIKQVPR
jgi:hypothetical protein